MASRRRSALLDELRVDVPGRPQDVILEELRRALLSGAAPPGTPIPVGEVTELFGVSRIPVHEALETLIGEGLVTHRQNHGYIVAQLTIAELREMYSVRETLESASLTAAVRNATEEDDRRVEESHRLLECAVQEGDSRGYHRESRVTLRQYRSITVCTSEFTTAVDVPSIDSTPPTGLAPGHGRLPLAQEQA
ncbi:GntR family transcriptional regulator [Rhodococcus pyridinivorans]|uniref:GntR family transcriptional regulator n=1 Tax=Rhodococcus pyridinivorans TaxID=103816 RepID=UPI00369C4CFE